MKDIEAICDLILEILNSENRVLSLQTMVISTVLHLRCLKSVENNVKNIVKSTVMMLKHITHASGGATTCA